VQQDSHNGWLVRAGVRVKGEIATGAGVLQPYVRANVYRSGRGTDVTRFVGPAGFTDIATAPAAPAPSWRRRHAAGDRQGRRVRGAGQAVEFERRRAGQERRECERGGQAALVIA
jgi:hypothetical protein